MLVRFASQLIGAAAQVPLDRLLLETDSPDGLPALQRRQTSEQEILTVHGSDGDEAGNHPANIRCTALHKHIK